MPTEPDDLTTTRIWETTRQLERDLEGYAAIYGVDCRGLGFGALANALAHSGWCKADPASAPQRLRPAPLRRSKPRAERAERLRAAQDVLEAQLAQRGLSVAAVRGPLVKARAHHAGLPFLEVMAIKRNVVTHMAQLKAEGGGYLLSLRDLGVLFEGDPANFRRLRDRLRA